MFLKSIFSRLECSILLGSLLFSLLTGCAAVTDLSDSLSESMFGREEVNPPAELNPIQATVNAKILWTAKLGESDLFDFSPATEGGMAYLASAQGELAKIDYSTGKPVWRIQAAERLSAGVGVGSNAVYVGTPKGQLLAFDFNGKPLWTAQLSSELLSVPKSADGIVVVRAGDNKIYGLNASDGVRKWVYERNNPSLSLRSSAGVAVDSGVIYAGFAGGKLVAIRLEDGRLGWEASVAQPKGVTEIERIADITSLPVVDGPLVYAVAYQGRIAAIDRTNGKMVWNRDISSYTGLSAADARVYVSHALGSAYSLDYSSGKTYWRQGDLQYRKLTAPLAMDALIAFGDVEGYVHFLKKEDGSFSGRIQTENSPIMPQMVEIGTGRLLVQTRQGGIFAIEVK